MDASNGPSLPSIYENLALIYEAVSIDAVSEIRLLALHAGKGDDPVHCSLVAFSRDEIWEAYEALSYTWGPSIYNRTVTVNNHRAPVTDNLFYALKRLRHPSEERLIWVDAICIDQSNSVERSIQVQHIRRVYSSARRVLVWLGNSNERETIAVERFQADLAALADEWHRESLLQAVAQTNPKYWERVWVWQEFAAARKPPLICFGRVQLELDDFNKLAVSIRQDEASQSERSPTPQHSESHPGKVHVKTPMDHLKSLTACISHLESLRLDGGFTDRLFSEMIRKTINANATDPRDKIFSLVGFLKPHDAKQLKPDYTMPIDKVSVAGTRTYMLETDMTTALSWAQLGQMRSTSSKVPSWSIDFEKPPELGDREMWFKRFDCTLPRAKDATLMAPKFNWEALSVTLSGVKFDRIYHAINYPVPGLSQACDELWIGLETDFSKLKRDDVKNAPSAWDDLEEEPPLSDELAILVNLVLSRQGCSQYRTSKWQRDHEVKERINTFSFVPNGNHSFSAQPREETIFYQKQVELRRSVEEQWEDEIKSWDADTLSDPEFRDRWEKFHRKSDISKLFTLWSRCIGFPDLDHATNYRIFHEAWQYYTQATAKQPAIFTTSKGFIGIAPNSILRGDIITILSGVGVPVLLRQIGDHYTFQGLCYCHGIMYGEISHICSEAKFEEVAFEVW